MIEGFGWNRQIRNCVRLRGHPEATNPLPSASRLVPVTWNPLLIRWHISPNAGYPYKILRLDVPAPVTWNPFNIDSFGLKGRRNFIDGWWWFLVDRFPRDRVAGKLLRKGFMERTSQHCRNTLNVFLGLVRLQFRFLTLDRQRSNCFRDQRKTENGRKLLKCVRKWAHRQCNCHRDDRAKRIFEVKSLRLISWTIVVSYRHSFRSLCLDPWCGSPIDVLLKPQPNACKIWEASD